MDDILSIKEGVLKRVRERRKESGMSQLELAQKSGVSFGSIKRFERKGELSLTSLIKIAFTLGYEEDFKQLFSRKKYKSLDEVINEAK